MDLTALKGLAEAVNLETTQPSSSHANLARLTASFMKEVINLLEPRNEQAPYSPRNQVQATIEQPSPEIGNTKPIKKTKRSKK